MVAAVSADFVHTGPGTLAGRYLRLFWQPVWLSRELGRGRAVPIQVMGEDFTLYRDTRGAAHVVAPRCPHRGTQLSTGDVDGDGIACRYHGWKFAHTGECVEQPAEPEPFCDKVRIASYPTHETAGFVFAYLGPPPAPPPPHWPEVGDFAYRHRIDCNYFQSAENIMDDAHVSFAHRRSLLNLSTRMSVPRVAARETAFGLTLELQYGGSVERNHFIMPNVCHLVDRHAWGTLRVLFAYVPVDDTHHQHFLALSSTPAFAARVLGRLIRLQRNVDAWYSDRTREILSGRRTLEGVISPRLQDSVLCVGQGAIADRSAERLGRTDAGVILLRKIWQRELELFEAGRPPARYQRPETFPSGDGDGATA